MMKRKSQKMKKPCYYLFDYENGEYVQEIFNMFEKAKNVYG